MELNPQQQAFLKGYIDPKSPTWGNALQSGLKILKRVQKIHSNILVNKLNYKFYGKRNKTIKPLKP